jgi:hypothetical protein
MGRLRQAAGSAGRTHPCGQSPARSLVPGSPPTTLRRHCRPTTPLRSRSPQRSTAARRRPQSSVDTARRPALGVRPKSSPAPHVLRCAPRRNTLQQPPSGAPHCRARQTPRTHACSERLTRRPWRTRRREHCKTEAGPNISTRCASIGEPAAQPTRTRQASHDGSPPPLRGSSEFARTTSPGGRFLHTVGRHGVMPQQRVAKALERKRALRDMQALCQTLAPA